ncbi:3-beta-hydroxysteroid-Delta(8),Delta(7)-isomerase [Obelidium mucronatum]|nr:3-beta-hydroxysteroid-Delta(8),Delta(7)-isomerase [Obelidium mucronatum]
MLETLTIFFSFVIVAMTIATILISRKTSDTNTRLLFIWFVTCGFIHFIVEGYFSFTNGTIAGDQTVLSAVWKEYAMSDSRYMTSDPFVTVMEGFTAVLWGPLSIICAYLIYHNKPSRHLLQTLVSFGQLYGLLLYYGTEIFDKFDHASPASSGVILEALEESAAVAVAAGGGGKKGKVGGTGGSKKVN